MYSAIIYTLHLAKKSSTPTRVANCILTSHENALLWHVVDEISALPRTWILQRNVCPRQEAKRVKFATYPHPNESQKKNTQDDMLQPLHGTHEVP